MSAGSVAVVDSWAALAFLRKEGAADATMRRYLKRADSGNVRLLMNLVNLGEVYYRMTQLTGVGDADERLRLFRRLPIEMVPVREPLALEAGRVKAQYRISFADAFAVATARVENGTVLTGDPEILALPRNVVRVVRLER
jgi:predicted nucleic acid-binding protein